MDFKKNNYLVIKNAVPKIITDLCLHYILLKREVFLKCDYLKHFGSFEDPMIPNTYSNYSDILMETLLVHLLKLMEYKTKLKLVPTYSYCRVYKKGDELKRHKDRDSCEISTTLNLGGDLWPIHLEPSGDLNKKGIKINLTQGDMLIYKGCMVEHWREPFKGDTCCQVFLHYSTDLNNKFDKRTMLGMPKSL